LVFAGFRFPPDVIIVVVRWYLRYALSYRDVEELLAERRVQVDHVSVYRWVQRFTPLLINVARACRHACGDRWFVMRHRGYSLYLSSHQAESAKVSPTAGLRKFSIVCGA
jgi:transposase-like protein